MFGQDFISYVEWNSCKMGKMGKKANQAGEIENEKEKKWIPIYLIL